MSPLLGRLLFLLALWSQILASMLAARAMPSAGDPLSGPMLPGLTICGHGPADSGLSGAGDETASGGRHAPAAPNCALCCAVVAVPQAPPPTVGGVALAWTVLVFLAPPDGLPASVHRAVPRARDPPALA